MNKPTSIVRELLLTFVVAIGIAAAWCFASLWLGMLVDQVSISRQGIESLMMRQDGEPVITRYQSGAYVANQQIFTLDGEAARGNSQSLMSPSYLQSAPQDLSGSNYPYRLAGANDGGNPATLWYLFHDGRPNGRAYGVGYDAASKTVAGYFGRNGFSASQPPRDEWFQIAGSSGLSAVTTAITNSEPFYNEPNIYFLAEGEVWWVDVRRKQVQSLLKAPAAFTVGWAWQTLAELPPDDNDPSTVQIATPYPRRKLAVRSADHMTMLDLLSGDHVDLPLPTTVRDKSCAVFEQADGGFVLFATPMVQHNGQRHHDVVWLDEAGKVQRERQVEITAVSTLLSSPGIVTWVPAVTAPLPLASAALALGISAERRAMQEFETFPAALAATIGEFWPGFLVVAGVSVALAIAAYRRQRRYSLPYAAWWAVFVFLLGVPGYLAYRFHRTWPALEDCPRCGEASPRDRDRCSDCGAAFPPPELKGLEIYA
jgi:hypothetical protein